MVNPINPKFLRRAGRVLATFLAILALLWFGLFWYVQSHKQEIIARVNKALSEKLDGQLKIGKLDFSLLRSFPNVAILLQNVSLRDSLWERHHHSLLEAKELAVTLNLFPLLKHETDIKRLNLSGANIFLYTDSTGYSNTYLLQKRDTTNKSNSRLHIGQVGLEDVDFVLEIEWKHKFFHIHLDQLNLATEEAGTNVRAAFRGNAHVFEFNFNTLRGSYLHNQDLLLNGTFNYNRQTKILDLPTQAVRIGMVPIQLKGQFNFASNPPAFSLQFSSNNLSYKTAASWLSPNISKMLNKFDFKKPIALIAHVSGVMQYKSIPLVKLDYQIADNTFITPFVQLDKVNYKGIFTNEATLGAGHGDDNSLIGLYNLQAEWQGIPIKSDTLEVHNLIKPIAKAQVTSSFDLTQLNKAVGSDVLQFDHGRAVADIRYQGGIQAEDPSPYDLEGFVKITDAGIIYKPRNIAFRNVAANLQFAGDNLFIRNATLQSGKSNLAMEGDALHFLHFFFNDPSKIVLNWRIHSTMIDLDDFIGFMGVRNSIGNQEKLGKKITQISSQLNKVLDEGTVKIDANISRLVFKNFVSDGVVAQVGLQQNNVIVDELKVRQGRGFATLSGKLVGGEGESPFNIKSSLKSMDVARLFRSFDNFGQDAITAENLEGAIDADTHIQGTLLNNAGVKKGSLKGYVTFNLKDGAINNFEPFLKLSKFVFKNRNLDAVQVKNLHGTINIDGPKILIEPMHIKTTVVNMQAQGVYGLDGGTDIALDIPLRNPQKEAATSLLGKLFRKGTGVVVHLRAQDPDGSGVKITWDPLRKGARETADLLGE